MKRDKVLQLKEKALDRMLLCYSVFAGNKPPRPEHCVELHAHAAFVHALCAELGEPIPNGNTSVVDRLLVRQALEWLIDIDRNDDETFSFIDQAIETLRAILEGDHHG